MDYDKLKIREDKYWSVFLHENQTALGRSYLWCKRDGVVDFLEMTEEEKEEFFLVAKKLKEALIKVFQPDLFNYASLANTTPHLHVHIIPRYANQKNFEGITFEDKRWGQSYRTDPEFKIPEEVLLKIKEVIQKELI